MITTHIFSAIVFVMLSLIIHRGEATQLSLQLSQSRDTLEAPLGMGNAVMLKMSMSLNLPKIPDSNEELEVPVRLFLTDFGSSPTTHPAVELKVKIDCESTKPTCILPNKPSSFDSYIQFTNWMNQGYFVNQIRIAYDFNINVQQSAPSLAQNLHAFSPGGYHFIGTHAIDNTSMKPDKCMAQITWCSKRGMINTTTATLGGFFYLKSQLYPIDDHQQVFSHPMIEQEVFKKDETKKFYHHQWVAQSEITSKVTYEEFPLHLARNWPQAPSGTYSLLQRKPGDLEEIDHLVCMHGSSGEDVDISDGRIFLIDYEAINKKNTKFMESIVKDDAENLYIMRYQYSTLGKQKADVRIQAAADLIRQEELREERYKQEKEDLKRQLEATQKEVGEVQRKACEEELAQKRAAEEKEEQKRIKQETEQREKQEKVVFWNLGIDKMIQHIKELWDLNLTWGELCKVLEALDHFYDNDKLTIGDINVMNKGNHYELSLQGALEFMCLEIGYSEYTKYKRRMEAVNNSKYLDFLKMINLSGNRNKLTGNRMELFGSWDKFIKKILEKKMEKYEELQGCPHPRRNEVNKLYQNSK